MPQGYPAIIELAPSILEDILQSVIEQVFPPGQTFADPRPHRGPYALIPHVRLTLATPNVTVAPNAEIVGLVATLQDTSSGETGSYAIYFDVRSDASGGRLTLHVAAIDPARSQPIGHLPPALLHLALAGHGPLAWTLPQGIQARLRTVLGDPGRALLFITSAGLAQEFGLSPASDPQPPSLPLVRRLPGGKKTQGGGIVQVIHTEEWAAQLDGAVIRGLLEGAVRGLGTIQAEGTEVKVKGFTIPQLITGGLELELDVSVDGTDIHAEGPLYIGYYLERASSDAPQLRLSFNASKLRISVVDAIAGVLYALSALVPPLLLLALPGIPAALEQWVYGPISKGLARAANQGVKDAKTSLLSEALRFLPPKLGALLSRQSIVRLDFGSRGVTIGVWYRPPPRSGVTKSPLEVPLEVHTVGPAAILIGWRRPGDLFPPAHPMGEVVMGGEFGGVLRSPTPSTPTTMTLAIAGLAPFGEPATLAPKRTLYISGAALDGVESAHLVSGFHRRTLTITHQTATRLTVDWNLRDVPAGLWDLELEWSGTLGGGASYSDRLTFRNRVRTYVAAPDVRADDRPLRVLTKDGEPTLLQLASGLLTPITDLEALRDRLREAPPVDVDVVEVEVPLGPTLSQPRELAVENLGEDTFIVDAGELGRLRVRTVAVGHGEALAEAEALLEGLPRHELG
ncbi:MAG: hypothetical protein KC486_28030 [Myxococcales bacterium]|nr:hypothetical protein [Myxococcales bacterium]